MVVDLKLKISPSVDQIWSNKFVTYRRLWLDTFLNAFSADMHGAVLDVGGKRENKRGSFNPPQDSVSAWWYVNLDRSTQPNIFADVTSLPLRCESVDVVVCTEVLEHLVNPLECSAEIYRVLNSDGIGFFSVPFMYPVHADPYDFQRFTADGLRNILSNFRSISIYPMGGYLGTLGMLMEIGLAGFSGSQISRKMLRRSLNWLAKRLYQADINAHNQPELWTKYTTGYFAKVVK
jgi:SAM-dependent methyltransferase